PICWGSTPPYTVWEPEQDPEGWIPNSNRIADGDNGAKVLHLGYATAEREHAMLIQSDEKPAAEFANRMANSDKSVGTQQVGGETSERRFREDQTQPTLSRVLPGVTLVVAGTAAWPELGQLAATLRERPKSGPWSDTALLASAPRGRTRLDGRRFCCQPRAKAP